MCSRVVSFAIGELSTLEVTAAVSNYIGYLKKVYAADRSINWNTAGFAVDVPMNKYGFSYEVANVAFESSSIANLVRGLTITGAPRTTTQVDPKWTPSYYTPEQLLNTEIKSPDRYALMYDPDRDETVGVKLFPDEDQWDDYQYFYLGGGWEQMAAEEAPRLIVEPAKPLQSLSIKLDKTLAANYNKRAIARWDDYCRWAKKNAPRPAPKKEGEILTLSIVPTTFHEPEKGDVTTSLFCSIVKPWVTDLTIRDVFIGIPFSKSPYYCYMPAQAGQDNGTVKFEFANAEDAAIALLFRRFPTLVQGSNKQTLIIGYFKPTKTAGRPDASLIRE